MHTMSDLDMNSSADCRRAAQGDGIFVPAEIDLVKASAVGSYRMLNSCFPGSPASGRSMPNITPLRHYSRLGMKRIEIAPAPILSFVVESAR
jgi:hypothetical protein